MNDFIQMDIFFFISSITSAVLLSVGIVISVYIFIFLKRIKKIINEVEKLVAYAATESKDVITMIVSKIDVMLDNVGVVEKTVLTIMGTLLAKKLKKRGKIKKDDQKK